MGYMILSDFESQVEAALGGEALGSSITDPWINYAYLEISGAIKFEELEKSDTISVVAPTISYAVATGTKVVKGISRPSGGLLEYVNKMEYFRLDRTATGAPDKWTRHGANVLLHPIPIGPETLDRIYKGEVSRLVAGQTTVIPDTWDAAIFMLACVYGFLARNEDERALMWLARVVGYIKSRATAEDLEVTERGLELTLGLPLQRVAAMQAMLQEGGQ